MRAAVLAALALAACSTSADRPGIPTVSVQGRFTDVTPADLPALTPGAADGPDVPTNGHFADLDGDGADELVLSSDQGSRAYRFDGSAFVAMSPQPMLAHGQILAIEDVDGDGLPDQVSSQRQVLWGGSNPAQPPDMTLESAKWGEAGGTSVLDVDGDGRLDLVGGGPCCWDPACHDLGVFLQDAPRKFRMLGAENGLPTAPELRSYLGTALPLDPEPVLTRLGEPCASPTDAAAFFRVGAHDPAQFPVFSAFDPLPPDAMFRQGSPTRALAELSPMGAAAGDLDGDGRMDLVVSTNPILEILQGTDAWPMVTKTASSSVARHPGDENFLIPWGVVVADFDRDGKADLAVAHGDDLNSRTHPDAHVGPQQMALYLNQGGFRFADASASAGLPVGQWKALGVGDFDCDGDADLLVGGEDSWTRVLRNDLRGGHGISLKFRGTNGDPTGAGARVEVTPAGGGTVLHLVAGGLANPNGSSRPMAFAGLGSATSAERVRVTWPSGIVQELTNVPADHCLTVEEPAVLSVAPASRTLDPAGIATIHVTRPPDRPDARIEVRIAAGPGTLESAPVDGGLEASIRGGGEGSTVLDILLDGVPLRVHPRLWWTR